MLILTRRIGECVIIGSPEIQVVVLDVKGAQVRLGIKAPQTIEVHREEVYARIHPEYVADEWTVRPKTGNEV